MEFEPGDVVKLQGVVTRVTNTDLYVNGHWYKRQGWELVQRPEPKRKMPPVGTVMQRKVASKPDPIGWFIVRDNGVEVLYGTADKSLYTEEVTIMSLDGLKEAIAKYWEQHDGSE